jgi:hypothetical protein
MDENPSRTEYGCCAVLNGSQTTEVRSGRSSACLICPGATAVWENSFACAVDNRAPISCSRGRKQAAVPSDHQISILKASNHIIIITNKPSIHSTILRPLPKRTHSASNHMLNILHPRRFQRMHEFSLLRMIQSSAELRHILAPEARVRH